VERAPLALGVLLVDLRHDPTDGDETMRDWLEHEEVPYVVAATKADKLGRGEAERRRRAIENGFGRTARRVFAVSAETRAGIDELWKTLRAVALEASR